MENNSKIGIKQAQMLAVIAIAAPIIRVVPTYIASTAKQAGWLSPLFAAVPLVIFVYILNALLNKTKDKGQQGVESLTVVYEKAFGKIGTKIIMLGLGIWFLIVAAVQIRMFSERYVSTLAIYNDMKFYIVAIIAVVFLASRANIKTFAKFTEFFSWLFIIVFVIFFVITLSKVDIHNLIPVTTYDITGIMAGSVSVIGVCSIISYIYLMGEYVEDKKDFLKSAKKALKYIIIDATIVMIVCIGTFGHLVVFEFPQPFFVTLKNVNLFGMLEGIQSIAIAFWVISDFVLINLFVGMSSDVMKKVFRLKARQTILTPLIFLTYLLTYCIANNYFELSKFSEMVVLPFNIVMGIGIPIAAYIVLKLKGKISSKNKIGS